MANKSIINTRFGTSGIAREATHVRGERVERVLTPDGRVVDAYVDQTSESYPRDILIEWHCCLKAM